MLVFQDYNRELAVSYARRWALDRNPAYKDYELFEKWTYNPYKNIP